ncbi:TIGR01459 family HAD-type hydrolase [Sphingomonas sp. R647]|uniref:TIGR01459 family HAD-type hydrolase n=1 Tax=Sphingomonas sp. R647 TaxID=2875233 RepID=UPI001CD47E67|nr:TIGR01459 family HAD-type hydrolase [Sphingomonas sp. R647]MCA1196480.1 TIGR01459 family HAD-type hydrolase [Sphingomonas sp. R647]
MTAPCTLKPVAGLASLVDRYDAVFIDQFGVLHDGSAPYHGAVDTLAALADCGKRVVLLSNSGKRSASNVARLDRLGIPASLYSGIVTSGEVGWSILRDLDPGQRCLLIARDGDRMAIDGLPITLVDDAAECDIVLIAGSEGDRMTIDAYRALLAPAARRGVPAYCTNPDNQMLTPNGLRFGAGAIASSYVELGGAVTWIGKPYPAIYAAARALVPDIPADRILCIGDSIEHDIGGAAQAGIASCLVRTGIIADATDAELETQFAQADARPDFILSQLRW